MNNPLLVFIQQRIQKPGLPLQHEPNPSAWHLRKTNCTLHQHSSVLQTWTRSDLRLLSELLSGKTTFLDIPFCLLSRTQSSPDRADSVAGEECTFNSFWFHNSLCIVIIYHIACASFLPPPPHTHKKIRVYFFQNQQTADWLQMRNSDAGCRYRFPDELIHLSLGTDKLRCRKTLCETRYVIFKAVQYDGWTAELRHLAEQHTHPSTRVSRRRVFTLSTGFAARAVNHVCLRGQIVLSTSCFCCGGGIKVTVYFCVRNCYDFFAEWFQRWSLTHLFCQTSAVLFGSLSALVEW